MKPSNSPEDEGFRQLTTPAGPPIADGWRENSTVPTDMAVTLPKGPAGRHHPGHLWAAV